MPRGDCKMDCALGNIGERNDGFDCIPFVAERSSLRYTCQAWVESDRTTKRRQKGKIEDEESKWHGSAVGEFCVRRTKRHSGTHGSVAPTPFRPFPVATNSPIGSSFRNKVTITPTWLRCRWRWLISIIKFLSKIQNFGVCEETGTNQFRKVDLISSDFDLRLSKFDAFVSC